MQPATEAGTADEARRASSPHPTPSSSPCEGRQESPAASIQGVPRKPETYEKSGYTDRIHGDIFHQHVVMLLLLRARKSGRKFRLAMEYAPAGKFDDIYFSYEEEDGTWVHLYMQLKHTNRVSGKITWVDLIGKKLCMKYLLDSHNKLGCSQNKAYCILYTNQGMEYESQEKQNKSQQLKKYMFVENLKITYPPIFSHKQLLMLNKELGSSKKWEKIIDLSKKSASIIDPSLVEDFDSFQDQFVFAVNQPGVEEMKKLVKTELFSLCQQNEKNCKILFDRMLIWIQKYMAKKEGYFISNAELDNFLKDKVLDPVISVPREPVANFHKRVKELREVRSHLAAPKGKEKIDLLITATAGVGKTELALKIAQENRDKFHHFIWMVAENEQSLQDAFLELGKKLQILEALDRKPNKDIELIIQKIYNILAYEKCLFIFDNAMSKPSEYNSTEFIYKFLTPALVCTPGMYFVVTSQYRNWSCNKHLPLDCFSMQHSVEFLDQELGMSRDKTAAQQVSAMLGHLPLVLQMAVAYIKHQRALPTDKLYTLSDFKSHLKCNLSQFLSKNPGESIVPYNLPVIVMWDMTIESVKSNINGKLATKILNMLAFLEPDNIPLSIFKSLPDTKDGNCLEALLLLKEHSLIKYDTQIGSIHRLLQQVTRDKCDNQDVILEELLSILEKVVHITDDNARFSIDSCNSHAMQIWSYATSSNYDFLVKKFSLIFLAIANAVAYNIILLSFLEQHLPRLEQVLGWGSEHFLHIQRQFVFLLWDNRKYNEAVQVCDTTQSSLHEDLKDHRHSLNMLYYKALSLHKLGSLDDAWSVWKVLLDRRLTALGMHNEGNYRVLDGMCKTAWELGKQGKCEPMEIWLRLVTERLKDPKVDLNRTLYMMDHIDSSLFVAKRGELALRLYFMVCASLDPKREKTAAHTLCSLLHLIRRLWRSNIHDDNTDDEKFLKEN